MAVQYDLFPETIPSVLDRVVNVSSIPQRNSPYHYHKKQGLSRRYLGFRCRIYEKRRERQRVRVKVVSRNHLQTHTSINQVKDRFEFHKDEAFSIIVNYMNDPAYTFFIDPPYTVGGKRLYNLSQVNHENLLLLVSQIKGHYMLTYDNCEHIKALANHYGLSYRTIPMTTTLLIQKEELIISDDFSWLD